MVAQISPLVKTGMRNSILSAHVLGGLAGGLFAGIVVGAAGVYLDAFIRIPPSVVGLLLGATLLGGLAVDCGLLPPPFEISRQTPKSWACTFGPIYATFAWAADLALGLTTRVSSLALLVVPCYALLCGSVLRATAVYASFGCCRALAVVTIAVATAVRGNETNRAAHAAVIVRFAGPARAAAAFVAGVLMILACAAGPHLVA